LAGNKQIPEWSGVTDRYIRLDITLKHTNEGVTVKINILLLGTTALLAASTAAFAQAADSAPKPHHHHHASSGSDRLELLEKRVEQQAEEIDALKAQVGQGQQAQPAAAPEVTSTQFEALQNQVYEQAAANKSQASVKFNKAHLTISSPDGKYTFAPVALVQGDFASYSKGQPLHAGVGANGKFDLKSSGENFRRAQIGFQGKFAGDFGYAFVYDFGGSNGDETYQAYVGPNTTALTSTGAGTGPHIQQAWLSYKGFLDPFTFKIGAFATPANLGDMTASADLLFNERPSPAQLSRGLDGDDGRQSVGFIGNGDIWYASLFLSGDTAGKGALLAPQKTYGGGQEAVVGRAAIAPIQDPDSNFNLHLGGNFGYVIHPQEVTTTATPGVTTYGITFSDRPELRVDNITFLNSGAINAKSAYSAGLEAAASYGPLFVEGEHFWYGIERRGSALSNPDFSGWYAEGSWVVTGDPRKYNMATASFTRPSPAEPFDPLNGDWGAWELAARYSSTDLNYHLGKADAVDGGAQNIFSAGINFYPNDILKFMIDWQDVHLYDIGGIAKANRGNYNTVNFRAQVTF
jgi:phosphate-selective porin OprO/OprP